MLSLNQLSYHPPATPSPILKAVNFTLPPQEMGLIVGPSGSGKSTLLEIMAGLATQTSGTIHWRDQILQSDELQQLAGLVFQFPERHFCCDTVLRELRFGHPELTTRQLEETLDAVGLANIPLSSAPHALSGGQQRRLSLAVQLVRQPSLLLLDEPTAGLDWSMRSQLAALLAELKQHWSLLVVTHDPSDLLDIADHHWSIHNGHLRAVTG